MEPPTPAGQGKVPKGPSPVAPGPDMERARSGQGEPVGHQPGAAGTAADLPGGARHLVHARFVLHEVVQGAVHLVA